MGRVLILGMLEPETMMTQQINPGKGMRQGQGIGMDDNTLAKGHGMVALVALELLLGFCVKTKRFCVKGACFFKGRCHRKQKLLSCFG